MVSRAFLGLVLLAMLSACAMQAYEPSPAPGAKPSQRDSSASGTPRATPALPAPAPVDKGASDASASLLTAARSRRLDGDLEGADALLQRAQRIDPRNAEVYLELAELHYSRGDVAEARTMAERGLLYCRAGSCARLHELIER
ncbi:MAG: tetratricopeptide repeat protein [Halieaceae bacterium]